MGTGSGKLVHVSTFTQLRTRASVRFGDAAFSIITDASWKDYVNEAYREVCSLEPWPFLETASTSTTIAAGVRYFTLPTNAWKVNALWDSTNKIPLEPITNISQVFDEFPNQDETGVPVLYRVRGTRVEVYPLPTTLTTYTVQYEAYPGDLSADGDLPALPTQYHHILSNLAVAKAYRDDGNFDAAQSYEAEAGVILEAMRRDLLAPRTERYPSITDEFFG